MKLYIAVLDEFPDYMTPTLVAHAVLAHHIQVTNMTCRTDRQVVLLNAYYDWCLNNFRKVVVKVNQKEFDKISELPFVYLAHENKTLDAKKSCAVWFYNETKENLPNVLKYAKLWKPKDYVVSNLTG